MWLLLQSFGTWFLQHVLRVAVIKFAVFTVITILLAGLASYIFNSLVNIDLEAFRNMLGSLPPGLLYFLSVFQVHVGIPLMLAAFVARFAIRRIPFIG
tara:strand:- start:1268 stop:1561 length:294 start_codon:yes stop_codon:yes gene_type:complete